MKTSSAPISGSAVWRFFARRKKQTADEVFAGPYLVELAFSKLKANRCG
jgi:hypothetical protein